MFIYLRKTILLQSCKCNFR